MIPGVPQSTFTTKQQDALDAAYMWLRPPPGMPGGGSSNSLPYWDSSGNPATTTLTPWAQTLLDDPDASTARTTLGLGTAAVENMGISAHKVPFLDGLNTWSSKQTITHASAPLMLELDYVEPSQPAGPLLTLYRNSASPVAADQIGSLRWDGNNAGLTQVSSYIKMYGAIDDPTTGLEDAHLNIDVLVNGVQTTVLGIYGTGIYESGALLINKYARLAATNTFTFPQFISVTTSGDALTLISSDATTANSASFRMTSTTAAPVALDVLGILSWYSNNSFPASTSFAMIYPLIIDPTDGSEDSNYYFFAQAAGVWTQSFAVSGLATMSLQNSDPGTSTAPIIDLYRLSPSPIAGDGIGALRFQGYNTAVPVANKIYFNIYALIADPTSTQEDAQFIFNALSTGATWTALTLNNTAALFNFRNAGTNLQISNSDPGNAGAHVQFYRPSGSPLASDTINITQFLGQRSTDLAQLDYARFGLSIIDPTTGSEDSLFYFYTRANNNYQARLALAGGIIGYDAAGAQAAGGDKGFGTLNVNTIYESGVSLINKYATLAGGNNLTGTQYVTTAAIATLFISESTEPGATSFTPFEARRTSASPATLDFIGQVVFSGRNSTPAYWAYAWFDAQIGDVTSGSEDAAIRFLTYAAGVPAVRLQIGSGSVPGGGVYHPNATGTDKGNNTLNFGTIYENGTSLLNTYATLAGGNLFTGGAQTVYGSAAAILLTLTIDDPGLTNGPGVYLRRNSVSPAAGDALAYLVWALNDTAAPQLLLNAGSITMYILDPTTTSVDTKWDFTSYAAGGYAVRMSLAGGLYHPSATGTDKGNNTINFGTIYENGTSLFNTYSTLAGGNTFSSTQYVINATLTTSFQAQSTEPGPASFGGYEIFRNSASPAALDYMGQFVFYGRNTTPANVGYFAIDAQITDPTAGSEDTQVRFLTYAAGAYSSRLVIGSANVPGGGLWHGSATGGDKGSGTINFVSLYDDNVLLTSQPASRRFIETGDIDTDEWDAIVPGDRKHTTAHLFKAMLDDGFDPREPEQFVAKFRADEVLPGMPGKDEFTIERHNAYCLGEVVSRHWLASDIMGVTLASTIDRLVAAEARIAELERTLH